MNTSSDRTATEAETDKDGLDYVIVVNFMFLFMFFIPFIVELLRWICGKLSHIALKSLILREQHRRKERLEVSQQKKVKELKTNYPVDCDGTKISTVNQEIKNVNTQELLEEVAFKLKKLWNEDDLNEKAINNSIANSDNLSQSIAIFRDIKNDLDRREYQLGNRQLKAFVLSKLMDSVKNSVKSQSKTSNAVSKKTTLQEVNEIKNEKNRDKSSNPLFKAELKETNNTENDSTQDEAVFETARESLSIPQEAAIKANETNETLPATPRPSLLSFWMNNINLDEIETENNEYVQPSNLKERIENMMASWLRKRLPTTNLTDTERLDYIAKSLKIEIKNDDDNQSSISENSDIPSV